MKLNSNLKLKKYFSNKNFFCGFVMASSIFLLMILGFFVMPYDPNKINVSQKFLGFSSAHIFGTDYLGRDVFSRLMYASRVSIFVGSAATIFGLVVGTFFGALGGYFGGIADSLITKIIDVQLSFPGILLALMLIAVFGNGLQITILALSIMSVPRFARIAHSGFLKYHGATFVLASKARGASDARIILRHILPNIAGDITVTATLSFSLAVLSESGLSYLGLGVQPPLVSFGRMLSEAQRFILTDVTGLFVPAIALVILALGFNLLGDGISQVNRGGE